MARRFFAGNDAGTWKFRISKPGFDARTAAADSPGLVFDAVWQETLQIHAILEVVSPGSSVTSFSVSWDPLPFIPFTEMIIDQSAFIASSLTSFAETSDPIGGSMSAFTEITASGAIFRVLSPNAIAPNTYFGRLFVFNTPSI